MPIDPNIPLQVQPLKLESPVNQLAMMNEAAKLGEYQRGIETQNKMRDLYSQGVDVSTPEGFKQLAAIDVPTAMKLKTQALEGRKLTAETGLKEFELDKNKIDRAITDISNHPTAEAAFADIQKRVQAGELPADKANFIVGQLRSMPYEKFQMTQIRNLLGAKDRLTLEEQAKHNRTTEGISAGHLQIAKENAAGVAQTLTDAAGNVTLLDRQGNIIKKLDAAGKPSATFEKTAALQKQQGKDLNLAISEIENAIKPGGALEKSTASGAGRLRDAAGNFIGYATEGSIASATLKPVADLALKMVPRFEGPQSDKDTASYKEASGQLANENLPVATRKAAAQTVVRLMKARKGQFVNETMANEGIGAGGPALPPGFTPDK
jgi:hypothetical protein